MKVILKGKPPATPRECVIAIETCAEEIAKRVGGDPADCVFMLLTAASSMAARHGTVPLPEVARGLGDALGKALVVADEMFDLRQDRKAANDG